MNRLSACAFSTMALLGAFATTSARADFSITVLHNNDGESGLFAGGGVGGIAEFKTQFDQTKSFYQGIGHGVVSVYAGDTFLAGPQFQASLDSNLGGANPDGDGTRRFYDALAISRIGYDASIIGNHEFDFGPDVLTEFIGDAQTTNTTTYLSANLDFTGTSLAALPSTQLAPSKLVTVTADGSPVKVGIIGATTSNLPFISSPGGVSVNAVAAAVDAQVTSLQGQGADVIILGSHLQGIAEDQSLVSSLSANSQSAINLIIAGGGDELLASNVGNSSFSPTTANAGAPVSVADTGLISGDTVEGSYPNTISGIPIVTTKDQYSYLGRVTLEFDNNGTFTGVNNTSNPQINTGFAADAGVASDIAPVQTFVNGLAATNIGTSTVKLLHGGSNTIRSQETNLGNLVADAQRAAAITELSLTANRTVGIANGGGIRADIALDGDTDISRLDTFNVSPFGNFVSVVEDMSVSDLALTLENAVSRVVDDAAPGINPIRQGGGTGRFAQVSGFSFTYDLLGTAMTLKSNGEIDTAGTRILEIILDDNTVLWQNGAIVEANKDILLDLVLPSFNARGGDQYLADYIDTDYTVKTTTVTDQQALQAFVSAFGGDLASQYGNENGEGRITAVPEPSSLALLGLGGLLIARRRRSA